MPKSWLSATLQLARRGAPPEPEDVMPAGLPPISVGRHQPMKVRDLVAGVIREIYEQALTYGVLDREQVAEDFKWLGVWFSEYAGIDEEG